MIFPIVLGLPSMFFPIPPLMMRTPATLPFSIQISPPIFGCAAVFTVVMNRFVEPCFGLFNCMLTLFSFIGVHERCCHK